MRGKTWLFFSSRRITDNCLLLIQEQNVKRINDFVKSSTLLSSLIFWFLIAWRLNHVLSASLTFTEVHPEARSKHVHTHTHTFIEMMVLKLKEKWWSYRAKHFYIMMDVMTIKDEVIFHQSEIAADCATTWHSVKLNVCFIRHGCTALLAVATSGSDLLTIRQDWTELRVSGEEEVAQSSATLAKHFITSSNVNTMKSLPTSRMWNHSTVVLAVSSKMLLSLEVAKKSLNLFFFDEHELIWLIC